MSYYRKRRSYIGGSRRSSGAGRLITGILVVFLVISLVPLLFSLGSSGDVGATGPSGSVAVPTASPTDPVTDPTEPVSDPTEPVEPETVSGYLLYQMDDAGNKKYLSIRDASTGASLKTNAEDACLYAWNAEYNTLFTVDSDRFLAFYDDDSLRTYAKSTKYYFAKFEVYGGAIMEGQTCPLDENTAYYLVTDGANENIYYSGSTDGGAFTGSSDFALARLVFVEYVTRQVVS